MNHARKEMKFLLEMPVFSYSFDCFSAQMCWSHLYWALIWYWDHLKNFIAEIPQGPLGMSIGTIWVTQKRFQGPPARGFDKHITKIENWLSYPHFWADFQ